MFTFSVFQWNHNQIYLSDTEILPFFLDSGGAKSQIKLSKRWFHSYYVSHTAWFLQRMVLKLLWYWYFWYCTTRCLATKGILRLIFLGCILLWSSCGCRRYLSTLCLCAITLVVVDQLFWNFEAEIDFGECHWCNAKSSHYDSDQIHIIYQIFNHNRNSELYQIQSLASVVLSIWVLWSILCLIWNAEKMFATLNMP